MVVGSPTKLNLIPSGVMPVVYINQGDAGYDKEFLIYNGDSPYNVPSGVSATIRGKKADGYGVTEAAALTEGSNLVTVTITEQMVAAAGANLYELVFVDTDGLRIATINMVWAVKADALGGADISASDISYAATVLNQLQSVSAYKEQLDNNTDGLAAEIAARIAADDTERAARIAADSNLQTNINAESATRASQDTNLQAQINQLIAPTGAAPSAAEVQNARIGADGVTYSSLGDAIRTQVTDLKGYISQVAYFNGNITDFGFRNIVRASDDNRNEYANNARLSSDIFEYINPTITVSTTGSGWNVSLSVYKNHALVFNSGWRTNYTYKATDADSFAVTLGKNVGGTYVNITPSEAADAGLTVTVSMGFIPVAKQEEVDALSQNVSSLENIVEDTLYFTGDIIDFGFRNIVRANDDNRNETVNATRLSSDLFDYTNPTITAAVTGSGWSFALNVYKNHALVFNSGWRTSYTYTVTDGDSFSIVLGKQVSGSYVSILPSDATEAGLSVHVEKGFTPFAKESDFNELSENVEASADDIDGLKVSEGFNKYVYNTKYYGHLFIDKIAEGSEVIIPCQSKWDIDITARLGFKIMEGNVHATGTAGKYIVMHGSAGTIGYQLFDPNQTDISNVVISNTPYNTLRSYKYRSKYTKYQTSVTELTEFLVACKESNLIPLITYVDDTELAIIKRYCGNNFILYNGNRNVWKGMLTFWPGNSITVAAAKTSMDYYGAPMLYGLPAGFFNSLSDSDLDDLITYAHDRGILIGVATNALTAEQTRRAFKHGVDIGPAAWQVNAFNDGNVVHASGDYTFSEITHTGTVSNGVLTLANLQGLTVAANNLFVGKAYLRIRFSGSLWIQFGRNDGATLITSDGSEEIQMSSIIIDDDPTLRATSNNTTEIYSIVYNVSKC